MHASPLHKTLLLLHLWAGLVAAVFLLVLGVTGSLIAFENEIDHALNAKLTWIQPEPQRLSLEQLKVKIAEIYPGARVIGFALPERADMTWQALVKLPNRQFSATLNPYTGQVVDDGSQRNDFTGYVHQLHLRLLVGKAGSTIVTIAALFLLVLAVSGLVLWWPRKIAQVHWRHPWRSINLQLHQALGIYTSFFLLIFSLSALIIHWDDEATNAVNRMTGAGSMPVPPHARPLAAGEKGATADAILSAAEQSEPDAQVTMVWLQANPVRVMMRGPGDHTPVGRTNVFVDAVTGKVLQDASLRSMPTGFKVAKVWNREIHTGDIGGLPTRILACLASLSLPVLTVTGPLIWWNKRRRGMKATSPSDEPV